MMVIILFKLRVMNWKVVDCFIRLYFSHGIIRSISTRFYQQSVARVDRKTNLQEYDRLMLKYALC